MGIRRGYSGNTVRIYSGDTVGIHYNPFEKYPVKAMSLKMRIKSLE